MDCGVRTGLNLDGCWANADYEEPGGSPNAGQKANSATTRRFPLISVVEILFLLKNQSEVFDEGELSRTHDYAGFAAR